MSKLVTKLNSPPYITEYLVVKLSYSQFQNGVFSAQKISSTYSLIVSIAVEAIVKTEFMSLDVLSQIDFLSVKKRKSWVSLVS